MHFSLARKPPGGMTASKLRGENIEISCAMDAELRDNNFNIGGHAIWDGIGQMDGNDQFEAEAIAAVSGPGYFALQKLVNTALTDRP
jgi:hypothetical protein